MEEKKLVSNLVEEVKSIMHRSDFVAIPKPDRRVAVRYFTTAELLEGVDFFDHTIKIELEDTLYKGDTVCRSYRLTRDGLTYRRLHDTFTPAAAKKDTTMWAITVERKLAYLGKMPVGYDDIVFKITQTDSILPVEAWMYSNELWKAIDNRYGGFPKYYYFEDQVMMFLED